MNDKLHEILINFYEENSFPLQKFNLFGIRNETDMDKDVINDMLGFFTENEIFTCSGTTDPSVYWTVSKERNRAGTFHLLNGFHEQIWTFGKHRGYDALINDYRYCKPTRGWRDANYNFVQDGKDVIVRDYFGINFHHMHENIIMKKIGKYSGGCQVVQDIRDYFYIYEKSKESNVKVFNYMLLDHTEV